MSVLKINKQMEFKKCRVEDTNNASCLSKYSMVKEGYFDDDYLVHFVSKRPRRSPVIHLGYHVRATVISYTLKEFNPEPSEQAAQIISFGAGFDTSFFRLSEEKNKNLIYYELDLPGVVNRKIQCIREADSLKSVIGDFKVTEYGLSSSKYHLLCTDLRDLKDVEDRLSDAGVSVLLPTLFLSECAITYLDEIKSDDLIRWTTKFTNATFVTYEQIEPDDAFGAVMLRHFENIKTPLQSVKRYPTLSDQENRYKKLGWHECVSISAIDAYSSCIPVSEHIRVTQLEPFDEWEEFHLKCCHYSLVIASQGSLTNWSHLCKSANRFSSGLTSERKPVSWNLIDSSETKLFGHCSVSFCKQNDETGVFIVGGFGSNKQGAHMRHKHSFTLVPKDSCSRYTVEEKYFCDDTKFSFEAMHATLSLYGLHSFILYGGRTSPRKCVNICPGLVEIGSNGRVRCQPLVSDTSVMPRWRHSAVIAKQHGNDMFVVYGGRTENSQVLGDTWKLDLSTDSSKRTITSIQTEPNLAARFAHSAAVMSSGSDCDSVVISGGLSEQLLPLNDVWELDMKTEQWREINITGMLPRYGHTSQIVHSTLILIGGVNRVTGRQPGICVINLQDKVCTEYQLPGMNPERPVMLINHSSNLSADKSSILVIGGGGSCFSFGTFFNTHIVQIRLDQFNIM